MKRIGKAEQPAVSRPWGGYTVLKKTPGYWVKKLFIRAGACTSLQRHRLRNEAWVVLSGVVDVQLGLQQQRLEAGAVLLVPRNRQHRLCARHDACVLEVAFGRVLEHDIQRLQDNYGRQDHD